MAVELNWVDEVCSYGMFKVYLNDVVRRHSIFQKTGLEYVEKKIAFAATPDASQNLDKAIVSSFDEAVEKVISLDCHRAPLIYMFVDFSMKMSIEYQKSYRASRGTEALVSGFTINGVPCAGCYTRRRTVAVRPDVFPSDAARCRVSMGSGASVLVCGSNKTI